jgi:hypothetical protein
MCSISIAIIAFKCICSYVVASSIWSLKGTKEAKNATYMARLYSCLMPDNQTPQLSTHKATFPHP